MFSVLPTKYISIGSYNCILHVCFKGAFGVMYKGEDLINKESKVVMKKIDVAVTHVGLPTDMMCKVALLRELEEQQHPNIVKYVVKKIIHDSCEFILFFLQVFGCDQLYAPAPARQWSCVILFGI